MSVTKDSLHEKTVFSITVKDAVESEEEVFPTKTDQTDATSKTDDDRHEELHCTVSRSSSSSVDGCNQPKSPKSVLFDSRSTSHGHTKKFHSVADCWECMVQGSSLIKVRPNGRTYNRYFSLDSDLSALRWVPSTKKASKALVLVSSMKEVRFGHTTEVTGTGLSSVSTVPMASPECAFSIIHGDDFLSLDLVAPSPEEASVWVTGFKALLGAQTSPQALGETAGLRERWLREVFEKAAADHTHDDNVAASVVNLDHGTAMALLKEINADLATSRIKQKMAEVDSMKTLHERGRINSQDFVSMFQEMATRPEIHFLLIRFANKDRFTAEDFRQFLECEQELKNIPLESCKQLIQVYEPSLEAKGKNQLLLDGMTKYLLSEEGDIFDPAHLHVHQDMSAPMVDYFISSSHNTYLLEDQLRGPSSVEGYVRALQSGCRCVKIDVWDGPDMPVVCHGNTLTTKIPFSETIAVIAEYAFDVSEYPLFLHLENHCNILQQKLVARVLRESFGSLLHLPKPGDKHVAMFTPEELRGKIVIVGKKLDQDCTEDEGDISEEDEGAETNRRRAPTRRIKLCRELSDLISLNRSTASKLLNTKDKSLLSCAFSLSESGAARLQGSNPSTWSEVTQRSFVRVFPNGSRVDSSNFNPQDFWNAGVQMVALNFQTPGLMMDLYDGKFRQNGGCGYVLKPRLMRQPGFSLPLNYKDNGPISPPQLLKIKIISGQQLPRPRGSAAKATVVDPYVSVQIYGISVDCCEKKTKTVLDEGDCPLFEESLEFYIHHPQMALVRFVVLDDEYIGDDFIGQYTIPFSCMRTGYRHIRLLSNLGEALENATLFVHVSITEKWAGEYLQKGKTKQAKKQATIRMTGIKQTDDAFKAIIPHLVEANRARRSVASSLFELRAECGLGVSASIQHCLRVLLQRLACCCDVRDCSISYENEIPVLKIDSGSTALPAALHRTIIALERTMLECQSLIQKSSVILQQLTQLHSALLETHTQLDELVTQAGYKGKQAHRVFDVYGWNMTIINAQTDLLADCKADCLQLLEKVRTCDAELSRFRYRSTDQPDRPSISIVPSPTVEDSVPESTSNGRLNNKASDASISRCPTFTNSLLTAEDGQEPKLKGILKKSSSTTDVVALEGYSRNPVACNASLVGQVQGSPEDHVEIHDPH